MPDDDAHDGEHDLPVGSFLGKYEIVRVLGSGGMGVLYEARHPVLANRLAIKILRRAIADEGAERFRNEALAASRVRDDRLPQIFDIDQLDDGTAYIVMEYLEGEDLAQRLSRGPLDPGYAVRLMYEVLELLAKVHTLGIVHRDIKPANVFIARSNLFGEIPKLLDFGVAHIASNTITHAGQVLGTPAYMAPEQALDTRRIGPWTDVFSASVVLYELIAGPRQRPWVADSATSYVATLGGTTPPRPLTALAPWAPTRLWEAIERGLRRDPAQRYQDALEFARAIEPFAADRSVLYKPRPAAPAATSASETDVTAARTTASARLPTAHVPLAAKVAELRGAFARMRPRASAPIEPVACEQLKPGERRLVVVLYVQLRMHQTSGPPLAEDDQEQFVSQFLDLFGHELAQHGGQSVAQPDGGLIAVFGDNHVREDDAHRAVTAALAIGRQRDEATRLLADLGSVLTTRIGIHRGFVSRRERSDERMPIAGETVATARRLAEVAPLNAILATADAVEGLSDWLAIQPFTKLTLQGRARPVEAHEVLGTMRAASGGDSRVFVGRDVALADLRDAFGAAGAGTAPTVLAMTGAPGIGKTRLVSEFLARLGVEVGDELQVLRVQPPPRVSYGLWTSLFEEILARAARGHNGKDRGGEVLDILAAALDPERGALLLQQRTLLDGLIGRDAIEFTGGSPHDVSDRIHLALTLCLEAAAHLFGTPPRPLIVVLENLHRADPASLALIARVTAAVRAETPPLVLLTMRTALPDDLPRSAGIVEIGPLAPSESIALANAVAGSAAVSPAVHALVSQRAGGNPLFIEQLVIMLREETLLGASEAALRSVTLPVSLYGLFLERVDRLDLPLRDALRLASVLGVEFEREIYLMVSERAAPVPEGVAATRPGASALEELVARGFLIRRDSPDGDLYAFDQPQMQAAVYGTVLAENRQIVHGLAAAALERFFEGRLVRQLPRILHHFSQSGNIARTVHYGRLAGERALAIAAYDEAAEQLGIAAALQDRLPDTSGLLAGETLHRLATAFEWKGQLRQAATYAEQAAARLSAAGGEPADRERAGHRGQIAMTLGEVYGLLGEWQRSIDCYADAERWFNDAAMPVESAEARCCRGFSHRARGQPERGVELAREGWAVLEATNHLPAIGRAGHELGNLLRDLGRYDEALRIFDRAVAGGDELRREGRLAESMWGAIAARSGRAMTYAASGDIAAAIADQSRANELARRDGNRVAQAISEYHLAAHYLERGDLRAADESAERAYRQSREIDMPGRAFKCRLIQARVHVRANDWEPALERVREAFAVIERAQVPDDALSDAVDLLVSAADRVPHARLVQTMRIAWPHVSQSGSNRLQEGAATLASILGIDQEMTTTRGATVAPPLDEEATLLPGQPEGDEHA